MSDQEFIIRAQELLKEAVEEATRNDTRNKWHRENRTSSRAAIKKYAETEKGKYANSKRNAKRKKFQKAACEDLTLEEKKEIGKFYKNCPQGYEVDHIIPISKGGKHCLNNLQYLTRAQNSRKHNKTMDECLAKITSQQMLQLNQKEMSFFLQYLMSKISDKSSMTQLTFLETVPKHILCENVKFLLI